MSKQRPRISEALRDALNISLDLIHMGTTKPKSQRAANNARALMQSINDYINGFISADELLFDTEKFAEIYS